MNKIKIIILCILTLLLAACSGKMETVDMVFKSSPQSEIPKITKDVIVHTVVGQVPGEIIYEDDAHKWLRTELAIVSQHPFSLVENSLGKMFKAELVGFDEGAGIAYLYFKNSTQLADEIEKVKPETFEMPITYKERLQIKANFEEAVASGEPSEKILAYENPLFKQNPDEIELFVNDFELALAAYKTGEDVTRFQSFIANDALISAITNLSNEAKAETYMSMKVKSINIGEFSTIVQAELALRDVPDSEAVVATYSIIEMNGELKIVNVQYAQ